MKRTSPSSRLVSSAARSPDLAITGPEVARKPTPISRARIPASVVLPRPGGPWSSTWSSASPRLFAAWTNTRRFSRAACWPMNSSRLFGRSAASASSAVRSGVVMRAGSVAIRPLICRCDGPTTSSERAGRGGTMEVDRRTDDWRSGGSRARAAPALAKRRRRRTGIATRSSSTGLAGSTIPTAPEDDLRLSDRAWAEMRHDRR